MDKNKLLERLNLIDAEANNKVAEINALRGRRDEILFMLQNIDAKKTEEVTDAAEDHGDVSPVAVEA